MEGKGGGGVDAIGRGNEDVRVNFSAKWSRHHLKSFYIRLSSSCSTEKRKQVEERVSGLCTCNIKAIDENKNVVSATRSPLHPPLYLPSLIPSSPFSRSVRDLSISPSVGLTLGCTAGH